jgi:hypothetical protein
VPPRLAEFGVRASDFRAAGARAAVWVERLADGTYRRCEGRGRAVVGAIQRAAGLTESDDGVWGPETHRQVREGLQRRGVAGAEIGPATLRHGEDVPVDLLRAALWLWRLEARAGSSPADVVLDGPGVRSVQFGRPGGGPRAAAGYQPACATVTRRSASPPAASPPAASPPARRELVGAGWPAWAWWATAGGVVVAGLGIGVAVGRARRARARQVV